MFDQFKAIVARPHAAFAAIGRRPTWLLPFLLVLAVNVATSFVVYRVIADDAHFEQIALAKVQWDGAAAGERLSEPDVRRAVESLRQQRDLWFALPVYSVTLSIVGIAGYFFVVMNALRAGLSFRMAFSVICWSFVVYRVLGGLLTLATVVALGPDQFQPAPPEAWSPVSLGRIVPRSGVTPNEFSAISKLDPFLVWWLGVMAIGFAQTSRNLTLERSLLIVGGTELVYLALNAVGALPGAS